MHHFFVTEDSIDTVEGKIRITGGDVNHIKNVLRMKKGEECLISNGIGDDYICVIDSVLDDVVEVRITDEKYKGSELPKKIYLFQGLPKGDKMELIIQKCVELGVYKIIPVATKRSIVKLDKKKEVSKVKRWNLISESGAKQSRRSIIPEVAGVMSFGEALEYAKDNLDMMIIPYENYKDMKGSAELTDRIVKDDNIESVGIFIGPEGGFENDEVEKCIEASGCPISLGRRILRTETAGMMIMSVLGFKMEEHEACAWV